MSETADVVIVGGGAIGASIAYFLRSRPCPPDVTVVERDPSYARASTPRASGGVRRLFSLPENIQLSDFSIRFFESFAETMAVDGSPAEIGYRRGGYLFIVSDKAAALLEDNVSVQRRLGVKVDLLD